MRKLAVMRGGAAVDFQWWVQPYTYSGIGWHYDTAVAGPFRTRREAREARRHLLAKQKG